MVRLKIDWKLGGPIVKLAYPVVIAMLTQTGVNLVDTIMVGRLPSEQSIPGQSAIGISLILFWAVGGLISSISVGTQALTSRRFGEGSFTLAGRVLDNAALVGIVLSTLGTLLVVSYLPQIYAFVHGDPVVQAVGVEYSTYRFWGLFGMVMTLVMKGFFDGLGRTKVHMVAAIVMNVVNIILNYSLIFGVGPFPEMGVGGAGLASLIAVYIGLFVMVIAALLPAIRKKFGVFHFRVDRPVALKVVRVGLPSGMATLFVMTGFFIFMKVVGLVDADRVRVAVCDEQLYGQSAEISAFCDGSGDLPSLIQAKVSEDRPPVNTTATKVIMDIMSVVFMTSVAFGQATATLVGQSLGAGKPDLAEQYGWESLRIGAYFMTIVGLFICLFPNTIAGWFNPDPEVIATAKSSLQLMALSASFLASGMILAQALFGAGSTVYVMVVEGVLHFTCLIPMAYIFGIWMNGGLLGIWAAAFLYAVVLTSVMAHRFAGGRWKTIQL